MPDTDKQAKIDAMNWPSWRYDPETGEGKIFQKGDDIPKGWTDDPHAYKRAPAKEEKPNAGLAKQLGMTKKAMIADFQIAEVEHDPSASADDLAALYYASFDDDGEEAE